MMKREQKASYRLWADDEVAYLEEKYGTIPIDTIAKKLNRTVSAVIQKAYKIGAGSFLENGDYISLNQLIVSLGLDSNNYHYRQRWINNGLPVKRKRVLKGKYYVVELHEFWKWLEVHQDLVDLSNMEENILGIEPEWVKVKRSNDYAKFNNSYKRWTDADIAQLKQLMMQQRYTYSDIAEKMGRSTIGIMNKAKKLGIRMRIRTEAYSFGWTDQEERELEDMIYSGKSYDEMSAVFGKTQKTIRDKVFHMYGTSSLEKIRERRKTVC